VDLVRAGLGDLVDDRATCATILSGEVGGLETDFLELIVVGDDELRTGYGDVVVLQAVDEEVVGACTTAIDGADATVERAALIRADGSRREKDEVERVLT